MFELSPPVKLGAGRERSHTFAADRKFLERWFPRGRLRINESGEPCLVPRRKDFRYWELTRDGEGICVRWGARRDELLRATQGLRRRRPILDCGEEGFLYLEPCEELKDRLPMFSKARRKVDPELLERMWAARRRRSQGKS